MQNSPLPSPEIMFDRDELSKDLARCPAVLLAEDPRGSIYGPAWPQQMMKAARPAATYSAANQRFSDGFFSRSENRQ